MLILGGSRHHPGGLEGFCKRAAEAVNGLGAGWAAEWLTTDTAYLRPALVPTVIARFRSLIGARGRTDLIWLQWSTSTDLLFLAVARMLRIPVLVTPHLGANARLQRVAPLRALCAQMLRQADRIGLLFDRQGEEIHLPHQVPRSVVRTFLPAATLARAIDPPPAGPLSLIHAGRLSEGKGTFRMVEMCAALREWGTPFTARIIGRSDEATMACLRDAIAGAGLYDQITLTEWLPESGLMDALSRADILVHLSTLDSFPLIVLEAMAAGALPVVGEMVGARSMVEAFAGHVAKDSSAQNAAEWISRLSLDAIRRDRAELAAKVRADYQWDICGRQAISAAEAVLRCGA